MFWQCKKQVTNPAAAISLEEFVSKTLLALWASVNEVRRKGVWVPESVAGMHGEIASAGIVRDREGFQIHMVKFRVVVEVKNVADAGVSLIVPSIQIGVGANVATERAHQNTVEFEVPVGFPKEKK